MYVFQQSNSGVRLYKTPLHKYLGCNDQQKEREPFSYEIQLQWLASDTTSMLFCLMQNIRGQQFPFWHNLSKMSLDRPISRVTK